MPFRNDSKLSKIHFKVAIGQRLVKNFLENCPYFEKFTLTRVHCQ